jgi:hypothetical protein
MTEFLRVFSGWKLNREHYTRQTQREIASYVAGLGETRIRQDSRGDGRSRPSGRAQLDALVSFGTTPLCASSSAMPFSSKAKALPYSFTTCRLFVTWKVPGTPLARRPAIFLSPSLSTTPSSVTWPFFTMIRIGFCTPSSYFWSAG